MAERGRAFPTAAPERRITPGNARKIGVGAGVALIVGIVAFVLVAEQNGATFGSPLPAAPAGFTDAQRLPPLSPPGTCFTLDEGRDVTRTAVVGCDDVHDGELVGVTDAVGAGGYPANTGAISSVVQSSCGPLVAAWTGGDANALPAGLAYDAFFPSEAGWAGGDRTLECVTRWTAPRAGTSRDAARL